MQLRLIHQVRGRHFSSTFLLQDGEDDVYKRDFSAPTLEDHFNKTILPKVMQVSRFYSLHVFYTQTIHQDVTATSDLLSTVKLQLSVEAKSLSLL